MILIILIVQPTLLHLVPLLVNLLTNLPELKQETYSQVHTVFCAAAPLGETVALKLLDRFDNKNINFQEGIEIVRMIESL